VIDEQPGQVEDPRHPGDDRNHMQRFRHQIPVSQETRDHLAIRFVHTHSAASFYKEELKEGMMMM
jgi:hypothetical protein